MSIQRTAQFSIQAPNKGALAAAAAAVGYALSDGVILPMSGPRVGGLVFLPTRMGVGPQEARSVSESHPDVMFVFSGTYLDEETGYSENGEFSVHGGHAHLNVTTSQTGSFDALFADASKESLLFGG